MPIPMTSNTLYLVRHGENPANVNREFSYKIVDYSLNERGVRQAQETAAYFANGSVRVDAIFSSPLKRALETAQIIGAQTGHGVSIIEEFREINCGEFDGAPPTSERWRHHDEILEAWRTGDHQVSFPGGENYLTLLDRVRVGLERAVVGRNGQHIVIVAHGGIVTASLKDVCRELDPGVIQSAPNRNCAITELDLHTRGEESWGHLKRWASCEHLSE
ncbi:MAG: histidine phosphatase family protein [Chloroflexi bacterium]|nr:histidine phosphatase family protein [Chloroflexota bacterium]